MKLTAKVKLLATPFQADALRETLRRANACCDWISGESWKLKTFRTFDIHRACYHAAKLKFELTAQVVVRCIGKVADAYKLDHRAKRTFSPLGAVSYDDRILKWYIEKGLINIWTTSGRLKIPFVGGPRQLTLLQNRQGDSDLLLHDGVFYLAATCNADALDAVDIADFLGCDFGVVNIATDSDGNVHAGSTLNAIRGRHCRLRAKLQRARTRSAKRHLKKLSGKEARFARDVNHCISKQIVSLAERTGRGLVIEKLTGLRDRIRARRAQRAVLHSWAFAQLRAFLEYKAALAGVVLATIDPRNTSRECSRCRHTEKGNRPTQSWFRCRQCGYTALADLNAALNIRSRAVVSRPIVADCVAA